MDSGYGKFTAQQPKQTKSAPLSYLFHPPSQSAPSCTCTLDHKRLPSNPSSLCRRATQPVTLMISRRSPIILQPSASSKGSSIYHLHPNPSWTRLDNHWQPRPGLACNPLSSPHSLRLPSLHTPFRTRPASPLIQKPSPHPADQPPFHHAPPFDPQILVVGNRSCPFRPRDWRGRCRCRELPEMNLPLDLRAEGPLFNCISFLLWT